MLASRVSAQLTETSRPLPTSIRLGGRRTQVGAHAILDPLVEGPDIVPAIDQIRGLTHSTKPGNKRAVSAAFEREARTGGRDPLPALRTLLFPSTPAILLPAMPGVGPLGSAPDLRRNGPFASLGRRRARQSHLSHSSARVAILFMHSSNTCPSCSRPSCKLLAVRWIASILFATINSLAFCAMTLFKSSTMGEGTFMELSPYSPGNSIMDRCGFKG